MTSQSPAGAFVPLDQHYLLQAADAGAVVRRAYSVVAFGISFPAIVLFLEWLGTGAAMSCISRSRGAGRR